MTHTLCVVPARGGSKGIPRKNLLPVAGKPLLAWTLEQALGLEPPPGDTVEVVVSTDDPEIAALARDLGAVVVDRPADLASDEAPTEPAVTHALETRCAAGAAPDQVLLLQATSPVRHPGTLARALVEFGGVAGGGGTGGGAGGGADSMVGVVPASPFLWRPGVDGRPPEAAYDVDARLRRQDLPPDQRRFRETGSLYLTRADLYRPTPTRPANRLGGRIVLFEMHPDEGVDIDTPTDVRLAEVLLAGG